MTKNRKSNAPLVKTGWPDCLAKKIVRRNAQPCPSLFKKFISKNIWCQLKSIDRSVLLSSNRSVTGVCRARAIDKFYIYTRLPKVVGKRKREEGDAAGNLSHSIINTLIYSFAWERCLNGTYCGVWKPPERA